VVVIHVEHDELKKTGLEHIAGLILAHKKALGVHRLMLFGAGAGFGVVCFILGRVLHV